MRDSSMGSRVRVVYFVAVFALVVAASLPVTAQISRRLAITAQGAGYVWNVDTAVIDKGSATQASQSAFPTAVRARALGFWNNYQYIIGVGEASGGGGWNNRINVWFSSLNATRAPFVAKSGANWENMNSADTDGNTLYISNWNIADTINTVNVGLNNIPDILVPWVSGVCTGDSSPFSAAPVNSTHLLVTCYASGTVETRIGELVAIDVATQQITSVYSISGDYFGAGSLAEDGWFYFPQHYERRVHRYNIWTGRLETNVISSVPCSTNACPIGNDDYGLWRVRVFNDSRLYTMLYTANSNEAGCIRAYNLTVSPPNMAYTLPGSACVPAMWDFVFLPSASSSWPAPARLPLSPPAPAQSAPQAQPVPSSPSTPPTASQQPPTASPPPIQAPPTGATPPQTAPTSPPVSSSPTAAPAAAPIQQPVVAPVAAGPVNPRLARLVMESAAGRNLFDAELNSICNYVRNVLAIPSRELICLREFAPTKKRATQAAYYVSLSFVSAAALQAASNAQASTTLQDQMLLAPSTVTSGVFVGIEIIFDPSPLQPLPQVPVAQVPAISPATISAPQSTSVVDTGSGTNVGGIVGGIIAALVAIAIVIIVAVFLIRRKNNNKKNSERSRKTKGDIENFGTEYAAPLIDSSVDHSKPKPVDSNDDDASKNKNWEIDYHDLVFGDVLGSGAFGKVYKGRWRAGAVAIKQATAISRDDFVKEANLMKDLRSHNNVVHLFGICVHRDKYYIVMELLKGGPLIDMLRRSARRTPLNEKQRVKIALAIASGMFHLHAEKILHRDLAARNVLLSRASGECKIADFGMSHRNTTNVAEQQIQSDVGPIRWMAPESIAKNVYSTKTDVFSYGITLWEIMSNGRVPLEEVPLNELALKRRDQCLIPQPPEGASPFLVEMYKKCCSRKPDDRPSFKEIVTSLADFIDKHYPEDEDSEEPASPRARAMSIAAKKAVEVPQVEETPEEDTSPKPSSGQLPSGSRDDLSNAIIPKNLKADATQAAKSPRKRKDSVAASASSSSSSESESEKSENNSVSQEGKESSSQSEVDELAESGSS